MNVVVFGVLAAILLVAAAMSLAVGSQRLAILLFASSSIALSLVLLLIGADAVAAIVVVTDVVAVPLLLRSVDEQTNPASLSLIVLSALAGLGLAGVGVAIVIHDSAQWVSGKYPTTLADQGTFHALAQLIVERYALPFVGLSVTALAITIGSIAVVRRDRHEEEHDRRLQERRDREERAARRRADRMRGVVAGDGE